MSRRRLVCIIVGVLLFLFGMVGLLTSGLALQDENEMLRRQLSALAAENQRLRLIHDADGLLYRDVRTPGY